MPAPTKLMSVSKASGVASFFAPGTYSWTPPSGVSSVTITGQGGSRSSVYYSWSNLTVIGTRMGFGAGFDNNVGSTLSYTRIRSDEASVLASVNGITTNSSGESTTALIINEYYWNSSGSFWYHKPSYVTRVYRRIGTLTANSALASASGNFPNGTTGSFYLGGGSIQRRIDNYDYGTDSTGLGYTFPDNSAQTQYTDVAVIPQQQYSIVVGTDEGSDTAFVTIEWE